MSNLIGKTVQSGPVVGKVVTQGADNIVEVLTSDERLVTFSVDHLTVLPDVSIPGEPVEPETAQPVVDGIPGESVAAEPAAVPDASFIPGEPVGAAD